MSETTESFILELFAAEPTLRPLLEEHLVDNHGEMLPHLLMGDVERWAEEVFEKSHDRQSHEEVMRQLENVLSYLERGFGQGDPDVQELVSVSFLEHLPRVGETGSELRTLLGPRMAEGLKDIG